MTTKRPKVLIAVPNEGAIDKHAVIALLQMSNDTAGCELRWNFLSTKPIDSSRNRIIREFLEESDCDFLLFMDADNGPRYQDGNFLERVHEDKDVIALPTPFWHHREGEDFPVLWNCFDYDEESDGWREHRTATEEPLQEIDAAGSGCLLIARRVLEKVRPAFMRDWDEDGVAVRGSDMLFCKRAKAEGFRIWADYSRPCHHVKPTDLLEVWRRCRNIQTGGSPTKERAAKESGAVVADKEAENTWQV